MIYDKCRVSLNLYNSLSKKKAEKSDDSYSKPSTWAVEQKGQQFVAFKSTLSHTHIICSDFASLHLLLRQS